MRAMDTLEDLVGFYRHFSSVEAKGESPTFAEWAAGVAGDEEVLALLQELPTAKRQPNLVFAAARWHGAPAPGPYAGLREVLIGQWESVRATILTRATQTNEPGRCASLLPLLAGMPGPLALLEVGASGGLCLHPDRYSYRYTDGAGEVLAIDPLTGPAPTLLECRVSGAPPLPRELPEIAWRGGIDLHPLDLSSAEDAAWLRMLVWPEHEDRRRRLAAACAGVAHDSVTLREGDLLTDLGPLVAQARREAPDATLVVFHTAVLAYLDERGRQLWVREVGEVLEGVRADGGRAHWISNEGPDVLPALAATATCRGPEADFCLALDGEAVGWAHGHGRSLTWC